MLDFNDDEVVSKWKATGLLTGKHPGEYDEYEEKTLAWMLEDTVQALLRMSEENTGKIQFMAGLMLPLVVRFFRDKELRFMNAEKFCAVFNTFCEEHSGSSMDPSEFCRKFVEETDPGEFMF